MRNSASAGSAPALSKDEKKKLETLLNLESEIEDAGLMARIACEKVERAFNLQGPNHRVGGGEGFFYFSQDEVEEIVFIVNYAERLATQVANKFYYTVNDEGANT